MTSTVKKESLPTCDVCKYHYGVEAPAAYDIKTRSGPWANVCPFHFEQESPMQRLGTGIGQMFLLPEDTFQHLVFVGSCCPYCLAQQTSTVGRRSLDIEHHDYCPRVFDVEG